MSYHGRKGGGGNQRGNNQNYRNHGHRNQDYNGNSNNQYNNNHRSRWGQSNNSNHAAMSPFNQNRSAHGISSHGGDVNSQNTRLGDRNDHPSNNHRSRWGQSNNSNHAAMSPFNQNRSTHGISSHGRDVNSQNTRPGERNVHPSNNTSQIDTRSQDTNRSTTHQGRHQQSSRIKGVNKDTWHQFSLQDRIKSQCKEDFFNDYYHKDHIMEDTDERAEKKRLAVEYAVKKLMTEMMEDAAQTQNTTQDIYESDSEDSYMQDTVPISAGSTATANATNLAYPRSTIEKFIDSLRYNLIFNVGFDVNGIHPDDEKSCVCPCSKTMSRWRDNFGVNHMESKDKCDYYKKAVPKGLMDHLHKTGQQGGFLHRGIELYLTKLYEDHLVHIGHKALYNIGDDMYKKAEAEERRLKFKEIKETRKKLDEMRKKVKEQEEELKAEKERVGKLKSVNEELGKNYEEQKKIFKVLKIKKKTFDNAPTQQQIDKWCGVSRTYFASLKKIVMFRDPNVGKDPTKFDREKVAIKLPNHFVLQNFFDGSYDESAPKKSTFLFRDLNGTKFAPGGYFSHKLFLDWDVKFDAPIKNEKGANIKKVSKHDKMIGVDEGGPTSQFISLFCMQLGDLSVMLPFDSDVKKTVIDIPREALEENTDFIKPEKGSKVRYKGKCATVINHSKDYCSADLEFDTDREQILGVERKSFVVAQIPIKLFQQTSGGIVPEKDNVFKNVLAKYNSQKFDPQMDEIELQERGRKYYRAVGRFLLHVMADDRNPIPTIVMPELYRNILLRSCMPGSEEYDEADLYRHLAQIKEFKDVEKFFGLEFSLYEIEKEGIITKENFKTDFVPAFVIDTRRKNLGALREGLTLNGEFPLDILSCQPLEAINQKFFSKPTFSVADIVALIKSNYENETADEISKDRHELFMKQTLPQALEALEKREKKAKKDSSFLADFLFFATGTRCVPYCNGMPAFNLTILFSFTPNDSLPSTHTCENLMHIPWGVYDNNVETLMTKLHEAVEYALFAGFDRA